VYHTISGDSTALSPQKVMKYGIYGEPQLVFVKNMDASINISTMGMSQMPNTYIPFL
jgi:hypothetical protein